MDPSHENNANLHTHTHHVPLQTKTNAVFLNDPWLIFWSLEAVSPILTESP